MAEIDRGSQYRPFNGIEKGTLRGIGLDDKEIENLESAMRRLLKSDQAINDEMFLRRLESVRWGMEHRGQFNEFNIIDSQDFSKGTS